jgi:hypothetical protein
MEKQLFQRVKKTLTVLILVTLAVSLITASVSARSSDGKATPEKSTCETCKYVKCDCCCESHGSDTHWYCPAPGKCSGKTCSMDCARY